MLYLFQDDSDSTASLLPPLKRIKGSQSQDPKTHEKDEQVISESALNKLVGAVDMYNLEVLLSTFLFIFPSDNKLIKAACLLLAFFGHHRRWSLQRLLLVI